MDTLQTLPILQSQAIPPSLRKGPWRRKNPETPPTNAVTFSSQNALSPIHFLSATHSSFILNHSARAPREPNCQMAQRLCSAAQCRMRFVTMQPDLFQFRFQRLGVPQEVRGGAQ